MSKAVAAVLPAAEESSLLLVPASAPADDVVVVPGITEVVVSPVLVIIDATEPPEKPVPPGKEGPLQAGARTSKASLKDARTRASYAILNSDLNYLVPGEGAVTHGEPRGDSEVSTDLLLGGYVHPYANGSVWFAPHAILKGLRPGL